MTRSLFFLASEEKEGKNRPVGKEGKRKRSACFIYLSAREGKKRTKLLFNSDQVEGQTAKKEGETRSPTLLRDGGGGKKKGSQINQLTSISAKGGG